MDTSNKILLSGLGVGCFIIFIPAYLSKIKESDEEPKSVNLGLALASAVLLSIIFRALLSSIDISTYSWFQVLVWILAVISSIIVIGRFNIPVEKNDSKINPQNSNKSEKLFSLVIGFLAIIILIYFAFSSPAVISRWTVL